MNVLPVAPRNISAKLTSRTCVLAYRASLSRRYFSGSRSRSAAVAVELTAVAVEFTASAAAADRLTRTPGDSHHESTASSSPSTVSISPRTSASAAEDDGSSAAAAEATAAAQHNATTAVRATAFPDRVIVARVLDDRPLYRYCYTIIIIMVFIIIIQWCVYEQSGRSTVVNRRTGRRRTRSTWRDDVTSFWKSKTNTTAIICNQYGVSAGSNIIFKYKLSG